MNHLTIFRDERFGEVRTLAIDGEPWFVAADVCKALEIKNPTMALSRLDEDEKALISIEGLSRGNSMGNVVNESGLYTLVLGSKKQESKEFRRWITHTVIPSLRKTGSYVVGEEKMDDDELIAQGYMALQRKLELRTAELAAANKKVESLQPKANYYDVILNCPGLISVSQIAKDYGHSATWLNQILAEEKVQYKQNKEWLLYQKYAQEGYTGSRTVTHLRTNGEVGSHSHTYWTQKGRQFIYDLLKNKRGIVPIMEETEEPA